MDFIKDSNGLDKVLNLRAFKVESKCVLIKSPRIDEFNELTCPGICKLCGLKFKRRDIDKKLPFKMFIDLKHHLAKRGIYMFPGLKVSLLF